MSRVGARGHEAILFRLTSLASLQGRAVMLINQGAMMEFGLFEAWLRWKRLGGSC